MPVDEFGREVPAEVQQRRRRSTSPPGAAPPQPHDNHYGGGGASYNYQSSAPSFYPLGGYHPRDEAAGAGAVNPSYGGGGRHSHGGGGRGSGGPHSSHYGSGPRGPPGGSHYYQGRSPSSYNRRSGGGNSYSYSSPNKQQPGYYNNSSNPPNARSAGAGSSSSNTAATAPHPSIRYLPSPMLCGYLWKQEEEKKEAEKPETAQGEASTKEETEGEPSEEKEKIEKEKTDKAFTEYRRSYCDNYLKHVFNAHLDDSWFRQLFSPLARYEACLWERQRTHAEAQALLSELQEWKTNPPATQTLELALSLTADASARRVAPRFHVPKAVRECRLLQVTEVPSHVTNTQLWHALPPAPSWMTPPKANESGKQQQLQHPDQVLQLISSVPLQSHQTRTVYWLAPDRRTCEALWQAFQGLDGRAPAPETSSVAWPVDCQDPYRRTEYDINGRGGAPEDGLGVPDRKAILKVAPYSDTTTVTVLSSALSQPSRISQDARAASTLARALDVQQHVPEPCQLDSILETAEFAEEALKLDLTIAYLRRVHHVNFYKGCQRTEFWGDVLAGHEAASSLQLRSVVRLEDEGEEDMAPAATEETKDIDTETPEETPVKEEGEDKAPESTEKTDGEPSIVKDLLVQRLDDAIQQALTVTCHEWIAAADSVVNKEIDRAAEDLKQAETNAEEDWIQNHSIDDEGRARCSFHFCHKLFKDDSFLRKHLKKKHYEYCEAEQAKCHDTHMMKAWELAGASRPRSTSTTVVGPPRLIVPDMLVDCGTKYGCLPASLLRLPDQDEEDKVVVDVADPEPTLWQKEQEKDRIDRERKQEAEEARRRRREESRQQRTVPTTPRKDNFVDVDDMKEEVVTMSFDQVELPQPKKKKKKRKLL